MSRNSLFSPSLRVTLFIACVVPQMLDLLTRTSSSQHAVSTVVLTTGALIKLTILGGEIFSFMPTVAPEKV